MPITDCGIKSEIVRPWSLELFTFTNPMPKLKELRSIAIILIAILLLVSTWGCSSSSLFRRHKKTNTDEQLKQSFVHYERGLGFEQEGKSDEAIAEYKKVIDISPRPAAYYHLGLIYATKGDYPTAISNFEKAIKLVPTYDAAKKELERIKALNK